jgi:hypothetical protein
MVPIIPPHRVEDDVEIDHPQRDFLVDHAQKHEDVGHHHRGEELEEIFDPEMDDPKAPKVRRREVHAWTCE